METNEIFDQPAHERPILDLYAASLITSEARDQALATIRPAQHWWRWANRSLLFVGSALLLAGIVFFFAYNWSRMDAVFKFCVIEMGLWICAIGGLKVGLDKLTGKVLLLAASVFVGVLLAVFGQAYQTGADAYQQPEKGSGLGQDSLFRFQSDFLRGRPLGRSVEPSPRRADVVSIQPSSPNGVPRLIECSIASTSDFDIAVFNRGVQLGDRASPA